MINAAAIKILNLGISANENVQIKLKHFATKIVRLNLPMISLNFIITANGFLEPEDLKPDLVIDLPIKLASHFIHADEIKTFKDINISGDRQLALGVLSALAEIDPGKILYMKDSALLGVMANKFEDLIKGMIDYIKLLSHNAGLSLSQYVQYESDLVTDQYQLEEFYVAVDQLKEHSELLVKRAERLIKQ